MSVVGLSERRELVEALLGAPPVAASAVAAASAVPAAAAAAAPSAPAVAGTGQPPANIRDEDAASDKWFSGPLAANVAAAERGDAATQVALGTRFYIGNLGVPHDFAHAARWFRKAANQGFAHAQASLGSAYASAKSVPHSDADALKWFRLAS